MSAPAPERTPPPPAPFRGSAPFLKIAPPFSLPMRHFAGAALAFPVFAAGLALGAPRLLGFDFDARFALGLVHVLTLGWVAQTILGAWTQMIPVHGETPLASIATAKAAWWVFAVGAAAFIAVLWAGSDRYWIAALILYAGVLGALANLAVTHARGVRRDWGAAHFTAAFLWLAAAGIVGALMAIDRHRAVIFRDPEGGLIAHVHMAFIGFAGSAILGAGYRLLPGISAHQLKSKFEGRLAFFCLQGGLIGLAADALFFGRRWMPVWAVLLGLAYLAYFAQMRPILDGNFALNPSLAFVLLAVAGGAAWVILGIGLSCGWIADEVGVRAAYVYGVLVGFVTPVILSQIHKIAPFLVWLHVYSPRQWRPPVNVPKIDDLTSQSLAWVEFFALLAAVPLGLAGFLRESLPLLRLAGGTLLLCALAYAGNTFLLLRHVIRPDPRWTLPATQ